MAKFISLFLLVVVMFIAVTCAEARAYRRHHHYAYMGGHYVGGHGSSHKGGHYINLLSHNRYKHHRY